MCFRSQYLMMASAPHTPVLVDDVIRLLQPRAGGVYCDGTLGAAGHAEAVLEASGPDGRLIAIDRDPSALPLAGERLAGYGQRVALVHGTYAQLPDILHDRGIRGVDGILLDLGVSSMQLDRPERGFSFSASGPIDMRMDDSGGETALELIRRLSAVELAEVLRDLGEERYSKRVAARIKDDLRDGRLANTADLAATVASAIPASAVRHMKIHPATRTFQALRIAVNGELDQLRDFLAHFADLLAPGGRCLVISFHSLEDRLVKRCFRELAWTSSLPPDLAEKAGERVEPICHVLTRKPVVADASESSRNPRARSAKLRACERAGS